MTKHAPTIPEGLDLIQMANGVIIRKSWRTLGLIPIMFFALIWDSFIVFWYVTALSKPHPHVDALLFPLIHVAVGVGITYFALVSLVNKTDVVVTLTGVQVKIFPMPWPGNKQVGASEIADVMVRMRSTNNRNPRTDYAVTYAGESRKERTLIKYTQEDQAEYVANAIRAALNLKDEGTPET